MYVAYLTVFVCSFVAYGAQNVRVLLLSECSVLVLSECRVCMLFQSPHGLCLNHLTILCCMQLYGECARNAGGHTANASQGNIRGRGGLCLSRA